MSEQSNSDQRFLPSAWEERFENEINQLFDEAIDRLPRFVDKYFRSFRRVMGRNLSPKTTFGDLFVGVRNIASGISEAVGGPEFETTTYTEDKIAAAFEEEVLSPNDLESLLSRLFQQFEDDLWSKFQDSINVERNEISSFRSHLREMIDEEIAHDPKLAQAVRSGIHVGMPITLGYFLFSRTKFAPPTAKEVTAIGTQDVSMMQRMLQAVRGKYEPKNDDGFIQDVAGNALGITGAILGSFVIGGLFEFAFNSMRDLKGSYIRQINTARYVLLYGTDPSNPNGRGILHIVRAIERRFDELPGFAAEAFNLWLESGINSDGDDTFSQAPYFPSDAHGVTIEEALDVTFEPAQVTVSEGENGEKEVEVTVVPKPAPSDSPIAQATDSKQ